MKKAKKDKKILIFLQKGIDKPIFMCYNIQVRGGIAQLARATGSYPVGHGFKSNSRYHGPLVKRLRHRPFTAVTGVRFSHGSPNVTNPNYFVNRNWFGFVFYYNYQN